MTIATEYYDWSKSGLEPGVAPYNKCSPNLVALNKYLTDRWGGQSLGCYNVRPVRGGTTQSTHSWGAARDWRYEDPGPGRDVCEREILPFLIKFSQELGIQAIHDYYGSRIWRANRSDDRNNGWVQQPHNPDKGMGEAWAKYLHIEVTRDAWKDGRSVDEKLADQPVPPKPKPDPFQPRRGKFGTFPDEKKPTIFQGAQGDVVRYLQGVLDKARIQTIIDGQFGRLTDRSVRRFQTQRNLKVDGVVGQQTWREIDQLARKWRDDDN